MHKWGFVFPRPIVVRNYIGPEPRPPPWVDLPDELWWAIFGLLDMRTVICVVPEVCRRWHAIWPDVFPGEIIIDQKWGRARFLPNVILDAMSAEDLGRRPRAAFRYRDCEGIDSPLNTVFQPNDFDFRLNDIQIVMQQTGEGWRESLMALRKNKLDLIDAIMALTM